jgi:hypothetical protein
MKNKIDNTKIAKATYPSKSADVTRDHIDLELMTAAKQDQTVAVDRPGFDLGGSTGKTTAGTGLGLGPDASETVEERSLPGRHTRPILSIPKWAGSDGAVARPTFKSIISKT